MTQKERDQWMVDTSKRLDKMEKKLNALQPKNRKKWGRAVDAAVIGTMAITFGNIDRIITLLRGWFG
tara:strand:- start:1059 stop:1259 length:201 start_codon:yes stop_codon:yes gene_type:complete